MSHYQHFSISERESLWEMKIKGCGIREIARKLNRDPSSISRELKRNRTNKEEYSPSRAQAKYEKRRKRSRRKYLLSEPELKEQVVRLLQGEQWSPEEICKRLIHEGKSSVSYNTIYRALAKGLLEKPGTRKSRHGRYPLQKHLRRKGWCRGKKKKAAEKRAVLPSISKRPHEANQRMEIGHYEGDLVYCKQYHCYIITMVDRKTRYLITAIVPNRKPETVANAIIEMLSELPKDRLRSVTLDRGLEFAQYTRIMDRLPHVQFYFAHPASPWERGTNENTNGLLRQYVPKRARMTVLDQDYLTLVTDKLNHRPRKCLNWLSPAELFFSKVLHLT